jgi:ribulose-5-phosphate 4-epimerase/fuculose-1-phosphate aldolase
MSTLERQRHNVADAARRLAAAGLVIGSAGNVSERDGELLAITPTGAHLADLTAEQVAVVDLDGGHVDGELAGRRSSPSISASTAATARAASPTRTRRWRRPSPA